MRCNETALSSVLVILFLVIFSHNTPLSALAQSSGQASMNITKETVSSDTSAKPDSDVPSSNVTLSRSQMGGDDAILASGNFLTYTNPDFGFQIEYPSNWQRTVEGLTSPIVVMFLPPSEDSVGLSIGAENLPMVGSLEDYRNFEVNVFLKNAYHDFKLIDSNTTTLDGKQAGMIVYSFTSPVTNNEKKSIEVFTMTGDNKHFSLIYGAEEPKFSAYMPIVKRMIDSFEILQPTLVGETTATTTTTREIVPSTSEETNNTSNTTPKPNISAKASLE